MPTAVPGGAQPEAGRKLVSGDRWRSALAACVQYLVWCALLGVTAAILLVGMVEMAAFRYVGF